MRPRRLRYNLERQRAKGFVCARVGGLSSSFAPGDDLARCTRM